MQTPCSVGSQWGAWLRALPERVDLPITSWTEAEVRALGDPDTVREALAVRSLIAGSSEVQDRVWTSPDAAALTTPLAVKPGYQCDSPPMADGVCSHETRVGISRMVVIAPS